MRRLLPLFESAASSGRSLTDASDGANGFAQGGVGVGPMRTLVFGCHAAARDVDDPAASAVARACGQAVAVAHMAGHSREIGRYTKKALGAEAAAELEWQRDQIPPRFEEYVYGTAKPKASAQCSCTLSTTRIGLRVAVGAVLAALREVVSYGGGGDHTVLPQ